MARAHLLLLVALFLAAQWLLAWHGPSHLTADHDGPLQLISATDCDICLPRPGAGPDTGRRHNAACGKGPCGTGGRGTQHSPRPPGAERRRARTARTFLNPIQNDTRRVPSRREGARYLL